MPTFGAESPFGSRSTWRSFITRCNVWTQLNTLNPFTDAAPCVTRPLRRRQEQYRRQAADQRPGTEYGATRSTGHACFIFIQADGCRILWTTFKIDTPNKFETLKRRRTFDARVREKYKSLDISLAFTYGAPNHTNTRLRNALAALALLLFTFVCAALHLGFARGDDYCEPMVDTFFFNAMTPMPHSFGAAQAA